jgi:hypothetical protein
MIEDTPHPGDAKRWSDLETSVEAAAVLLSLAMRDTEQPVADLGGALTRLSRHVQNGGTRDGATRSGPGLREALQGDLVVCIQSLQFHDRLIQQLAAVRSFLASLANHHSLTDVGGFGAQRWEELLRLVRTRLTSDSHHQLFELLMRTGEIESDGGADAAGEGSIELF